MEKDSRKRWVANLTKEKLALAEQVRRARESERAMRLRFREMEREMEHLKRRDSPGYGSSGTAKQGDQYVKRLSPSLKSVHGNLSEQKGKMSKNRKHEASSGSSRSPSNFSVRSTRSNIVEKKVGGMHKINQTHTNSAASFFTPEGENQEHNAALSPRTSSPRRVLQQVKAKLAEYARLQGLS